MNVGAGSPLGKFSSLSRAKSRRKSERPDLDQVVEMAEEQAAARGIQNFDARASIMRALNNGLVPPRLRVATAREIERKVRDGVVTG